MPVPIKAILVVLTLLSLISFPITSTSAEVTDLQVSPEVVVQGEQLAISGLASPTEEVWLNLSFELVLPVSEGNYSREFYDLNFPKGKKSFSVTVRNIKNVRLGFYIPFLKWWFEYPLDGPLNATDGNATISISFPATIENTTINIEGEKDVLVYGEALEGATSVTVEVNMSICVTADSNGYFKLNQSTTGVPAGEYVLAADGFQKTVQVVAPLPIIDTGSGTYPSISGVHYGSIKPYETINVSQLYTYPCTGTGGHTEYAAIAYPNGIVIAEAQWNGYTGDWHNLTFNNSFTLYANETYNYTIRTGSYPQIIHEPSWNATGGVITCTEFVDSNGKRHGDWIPAIKLYYGGDSTPPVVTITSPVNGSVVTGTNVTVVGTATDDVGIVAMCYEHGSSGGAAKWCGPLSNTSTNASINWTVQLQQGTNTMTVTAEDKAGNSGCASVTVLYEENISTFDTLGTEIITCTSFVDVNGQRHEEWIPAIKLIATRSDG